jgi:hypothetical protein
VLSWPTCWTWTIRLPHGQRVDLSNRDAATDISRVQILPLWTMASHAKAAVYAGVGFVVRRNRVEPRVTERVPEEDKSQLITVMASCGRRHHACSAPRPKHSSSNMRWGPQSSASELCVWDVRSLTMRSSTVTKAKRHYFINHHQASHRRVTIHSLGSRYIGTQIRELRTKMCKSSPHGPATTTMGGRPGW